MAAAVSGTGTPGITDAEDIQFVTGGDIARLPAAAALHGETFKTDPVINFMLNAKSKQARADFLPQYIYILLKAGALNGAIFEEAWLREPPASIPGAKPDDPTPPACSTVWVAPGHKIDNWRTYHAAGMTQLLWKVGIPGIAKMLGDFQSCANKAKAKELSLPHANGKPSGKGKIEFWYLFFVSTAVDCRGRGLASKLIGKFQEVVRDEATGKAGKEQKIRPLWLEATTAKSRKVYLSLGFEDVDSWVLGKGTVNADGDQEKGGDGVRVWAMVWWPDGKGKRST